MDSLNKTKKIVYQEPPWNHFPPLCEECGCEINEGDECYYEGEGAFLCADCGKYDDTE